MTDDSSANDMKRRAEEALKKKLAATANSHADTKANGKVSPKGGTKQPKQRIQRHQGR
jgi:hypothetical protein